jgi:hypothetical protein
MENESRSSSFSEVREPISNCIGSGVTTSAKKQRASTLMFLILPTCILITSKSSQRLSNVLLATEKGEYNIIVDIVGIINSNPH